MSKLYKARSLLYRRQILHQNIRWRALDEIYQIHILSHLSNRKISVQLRQHLWDFQFYKHK